jgi:hypothetical protein
MADIDVGAARFHVLAGAGAERDVVVAEAGEVLQRAVTDRDVVAAFGTGAQRLGADGGVLLAGGVGVERVCAAGSVDLAGRVVPERVPAGGSALAPLAVLSLPVVLA